MARYPGAIWRPITAAKGRKPLTLYNRMNLHVAVSEASTLHGYFNRSGIPDSHFYVRRGTAEQLAKGLPATIEQYVDTSMRAFADLNGNDATLSVETQGGLRNANGEPWDKSQLLALANLYAWAVRTHGIKLKLATDSKPGASSQGLSWHRLGIDGNFPKTYPLRGRVPGGILYSKARGKICPGDAKIRQVSQIYEIAREQLKPTAKPNTEGIFGMSKHDTFDHKVKQTLSKDKKYKILRIADGRSYIVAGAAYFAGQLNLIFDDLKPDQTAMVRVFRGGYKKGAGVKSGRTIAQQEVIGTTGKTFVTVPFADAVNANFGDGRDTRVYIQVKLNSGPAKDITVSSVGGAVIYG